MGNFNVDRQIKALISLQPVGGQGEDPSELRSGRWMSARTAGNDLKRPGVTRALDALRSGEADTLVVAKLDRLSRSMGDLTRLLGVAAKQGWALIALDVAVDTATPTGEAMAHVIGAFSQLERRLIGQRTKEALAMGRAAGVRLGRPPTLSSDVTDRIVGMRADGYTLQAIADILTEDDVPTAQGGRRWYASTIRKVIESAARRDEPVVAGPGE